LSGATLCRFAGPVNGPTASGGFAAPFSGDRHDRRIAAIVTATMLKLRLFSLSAPGYSL